MKSYTKILSILAASSLVASIPVVLAQGAPPPPPAPPPAPAPMAPATGRQGGPGGPGLGAPVDQPTQDELAPVNKALKDLISKADPEAAKVLAAHPTWNPITVFARGAQGNFGANTGRGGRNMGAGSGRRGGPGGPGAPAGSGA